MVIIISFITMIVLLNLVNYLVETKCSDVNIIMRVKNISAIILLIMLVAGIGAYISLAYNANILFEP